ncbi:MAG TPA: hypothetical protein VM328_10480, partial [Fimbriimonadaceae bacterium]|nr:hypothetical protein [Fimbriimonadaceae bacterium]
LSVSAGLEGSPGLWSYRIGANALLNGGTSTFKQDATFLDAYVGYLLRPNQRISLSYQSGTTRGYLPQNDFQFTASYEYQLYQNVALVGSYKVRNVSNLDPLISSGAYRFRGFDLELSFNFMGR